MASTALSGRVALSARATRAARTGRSARARRRACRARAIRAACVARAYRAALAAAAAFSAARSALSHAASRPTRPTSRSRSRSAGRIFASICRMRSRVTPNSPPSSSSVEGSSPSSARRRTRILASRSVNVPTKSSTSRTKSAPTTCCSTGGSTCVRATKSARVAPSPMTRSSESVRRLSRRACSTFSRVMSQATATSAAVTGRPRAARFRSAAATLRTCSCMWTGMRMRAPSSAMARLIDCRIHQVAYVENLLPILGSNFRAARISPSTPCWTRSSYSSPCSRCDRTRECTSRRLWTIRQSLARIRRSPLGSAFSSSSEASSAMRSGPPRSSTASPTSASALSSRFSGPRRRRSVSSTARAAAIAPSRPSSPSTTSATSETSTASGTSGAASSATGTTAAASPFPGLAPPGPPEPPAGSALTARTRTAPRSAAASAGSSPASRTTPSSAPEPTRPSTSA